MDISSNLWVLLWFEWEMFLHGVKCLNTWSPADGTIWKATELLRKWNLTATSRFLREVIKIV